MKKIVTIIALCCVAALLIGVLASVMGKNNSSADGGKSIIDKIVDGISDAFTEETTTSAESGNNTRPSSSLNSYTPRLTHFATSNGHSLGRISFACGAFSFDYFGYGYPNTYSDIFYGQPYLKVWPVEFVSNGQSPVSFTISTGYTESDVFSYRVYGCKTTDETFEFLNSVMSINHSVTFELSSDYSYYMFTVARNTGITADVQFTDDELLQIWSAFDAKDWVFTFNYDSNSGNGGNSASETNTNTVTLNANHLKYSINGSNIGNFSNASYSLGNFEFDPLGTGNTYDSYYGEAYIEIDWDICILDGYLPTSLTISSGSGNHLGEAYFSIEGLDITSNEFGGTRNGYTHLGALENDNESITISWRDFSETGSSKLIFFKHYGEVGIPDGHYNGSDPAYLLSLLNDFNNLDWTITFNYNISGETPVSQI